MEIGTRVEVRSSLERKWARGFEIADLVGEQPSGYRIRRRSDGALLPVVFGTEDVREERRRNDMWWV